jgi:hypothetical protein
LVHPIINDRPQPGHAGADQSDRMRVGGVGLAALPGGEHASSRGQLRWHVDDLLPSPNSRLAMCRPMPEHPSIAHVRCSNRLAKRSIAR